MKGAEALLRTLVAGGVELCLTNPGTSEMQFVTAIDRVEGMRAVLTLFEGVASGAADGYARMTGRPACTLLHLGPGLANGLANFHNCRKAGMPVVNVIGEHAVSHARYDAPLSSDIEAYARPVSGSIRRVADAAGIAADAAAALRAARTRPTGIASLIVPADASWDESPGPVAVADPPPAARVDEQRLRAAAAALASGEPALVLLGGEALHEAPLRHAGRIAARTGARLMSTTFFARQSRGAGRVPIERLPYFAEQAIEALAGTAHLVLVGAAAPVSFFAYPGVPGWLSPEGAQIHTLAGAGEDIDDALARLAEALGAGQAVVPLARLAVPALPAGTLTPSTLGQAVAALMPEGCIVVDEGNTSALPIFLATAGAAPHDWLTNTGGSIGHGMPMAVGAALACPGRKVLNLQADGSAAYTLQALWTQAREGLDVTTVIFANRQYRILNVELQRVGAAPAGPQAARLLSIGAPDLDWVKLAEGMGVAAHRVATIEAFADVLGACLAARGPQLIEVAM